MVAEETAAVAAENEVAQELADEGVDVQEHLKDAVEGNLRLKRLLTRDDEDESDSKKQKIHVFGPEETAKVEEILKKWQLQYDTVVRHVLEQLPMSELQDLFNSSYVPDKSGQWKSTAELLGRYVVECREKKFIAGGSQDAIKAFAHRLKLSLEQSTLLRTLNHKELRHVLDNYRGEGSLEDAVAAAAASVAEDENATIAAVPEAPGLKAFGRFNRMELIDPLADCAVFGDANLTFSIKLAKHRKALGHVGRVIATTFEELDTLRERYPEIDQSIQTLEDHYAEVYHGVDCTRIAIDPKFEGLEGSFGAVYYNFPHSGAIQGFYDGHPVCNWRHENLMRLFFRALRSFVKPGGIVKVASNMGAVGVRYSYIVGSAIENEFSHVETVPFLEWKLHRYGRSYGDKRDAYKRPDAKNNQSYNAQAAERDMVYCFRYEPSGEVLPPQLVRLPPTLKTLKACTDGPFKGLPQEAKDKVAQRLHERFVTEVSGTHVG
eukprot:TRINITY_DN531_c0_g3_i1.p1 TRINITY_DN531_c0_g3~~TRINITY_DN531_c0_g3_i1.p1  ORF type:complete len:491 (-),score=130.49 TRINITY_DN531_c0_g3_i1:130-1602(-)